MSYFTNCKAYAIVQTSLVSERLLNDMKSQYNVSSSDLRKSIDGTKTLLKFCVPIPESAIDLKLYNQDEILSILDSDEWQVTP